ncbi:coiled-coil and C2 domain-containing protein 1-like isoform X1 [Hylaeus anthracinus]|uniref:coiled-coil and C2 domain-containing protein 1-like isoform X1 n=1 Tax=Hylaeus anthracinus TaxID=313031 RepID=UPI0023B92F7C|nr:coiled-coil and C2 domain-containing protein 1-like isoform X1 [Hylaeus anthracinus]
MISNDLDNNVIKNDNNDDNSKTEAPVTPLFNANLDAMIAESMKDIDDEETSDGDDDPELLREFQMITGDKSSEKASLVKEEDLVTKDIEAAELKEDDTPIGNMVKLLHERIRLYQIAEKKAKEENEPARARRFNRGIKTLTKLLNNVSSGKNINEADIPPQLPSSATTESTVEVLNSDKENSTSII